MLAEANRIIREAWAALPGSVTPLAVQEGSTLADCIRAIPQAPEHNHNGVGIYANCPACGTVWPTSSADGAATEPHVHEHVVVQHWDAEGGEVLYRTCACGEEWTRDEERCPEDDSEEQPDPDVAAFLDWLISMDDPEDMEGRAERQVVTLTRIIDRARSVRPLLGADGPGKPAVHDGFTCEEVERRCDEITDELNAATMLLARHGAPSTGLTGARLDLADRLQALMGQLVDTMLYREAYGSPGLATLAQRPEDLDALAKEYGLLATDSMRRASSARGKRDKLWALAAEAREREKGKTTDG